MSKAIILSQKLGYCKVAGLKLNKLRGKPLCSQEP